MAHAHGLGVARAVRRQVDVSTRALLVVLAPLFAIAIAFAREVLVVVLGGAYGSGAAVLQVVLLATYLAVIQVAAVNALSSGSPEQVRIPVFSAVAGAIVGLVALIPLGHWFGGAGVSFAYLIAIAVGSAGPIVAAWRTYAMAWAGPLGRSLTVVAAITVAALIIRGQGTGRVLLDVGLAVVALGVGGWVLRQDLRLILAAVRGERGGEAVREG
jgi:O-antigen/teichoic acid export membrane protein